MRMLNRILVLTMLVSLSACAWVETTPTGEKVRVLSKEEVRGCKHVGKTTVSTAGKIAGIARHPEKIQEELDILARNSAPDIGGDTVVPVGKPQEGKQVYEVYRCIPKSE